MDIAGLLNAIASMPRGALSRGNDLMARLLQPDESTDLARARRFNTALFPWEQGGFEAWKKQQDAIRAARGQGPTTLDLPDYDIQGAYLAGVGGSGHGPDTFKKPWHPTFSAESQYSGRGGYQGGYWIPGAQEYFVPGKTNIETHGLDFLRNYFAKREPSIKLVEQMEGE